MLYRRIASDKYELEYRQNNNKVNILAFLAYHENSIEVGRVKEFQLEQTCTDKKLSNGTLMEEIQPIVMEKSEIECTDSSKLLSSLAFLGYQDSDENISIHQLY